MVARPWLRSLDEIRNHISEIVGCKFNFAQVNYYKSGCDRVARYRDDEGRLDVSAPVAILSLGTPRTMVMQHVSDVQKEPVNRIETKFHILLESGSVLVIRYPTNIVWYHEQEVEGPRLNLTFRVLLEKNKI